MLKMNKDILLTNEQIQSICKRLGKEITETIKNDSKPAVIMGVLKGAVPFLTDLVKCIDAPIFIDFIQIRSYVGTSSSGKVQLIKDCDFDCEDRTVIIVEDIIDTGRSMEFLVRHFKSHNPKRVLVCSLFDKKEARIANVSVDFVGLELKGRNFLIGYGLDYNELGRNLPYVYNAKPEDIAEFDSILNRSK